MFGTKAYAVVWGMAALLCLGWTTSSRADTVFLNNGVELNGTIVHQDEQTIVIRTASGKTQSIRRGDVDTIIREKAKVAIKEEPAAPVVTGVAPATAKPVTLEPAKADPLKADVLTKPDNTKAETIKPNSAKLDETKAETLKGAVKLPVTSQDNAPPVATSPLAPPELATRADTGAGPPPIEGFPDNAKRMSRRKETLFADALAAVKGSAQRNPEDATREAAVNA